LNRVRQQLAQDLQHFRAMCSEHNISLDDHLFGKFSEYRDMLVLWNERVSLVSKSDTPRFLCRHVFESLTILQSIRPDETRLADIGTGAGLPGIPIGLVEPKLSVSLIESARMKTLFLKAAVKSLILPNVEVIHDRVENVWEHSSGVFDIVTARAVGRLDHLWELAEPLLKPQGRLVALKGPGEAEEDLGALGVKFTESLLETGDRTLAIVTVQKK